MACNTIKLSNGMAMIACGRGGPYCHQMNCRHLSEFQCDFPIGKYKSGKRKGERRDCNRHLCADHAIHGVTPGIDFCAEHYPIARANHERKLKDLIEKYGA